MPKRTKRSEKGSSQKSGKGSGKDVGKQPGKESKQDAEREPALPNGAAVDERGAFAVARCDRCGWQGAARRSRDRARKDLRQHLEDKPKHADHLSLAEVAG